MAPGPGKNAARLGGAASAEGGLLDLLVLDLFGSGDAAGEFGSAVVVDGVALSGFAVEDAGFELGFFAPGEGSLVLEVDEVPAGGEVVVFGVGWFRLKSGVT